MTFLRMTSTTACAALLLAACSSNSMMDDGAQSGPTESPQVAVKPSGDRGQSYGDAMAPSPSAMSGDNMSDNMSMTRDTMNADSPQVSVSAKGDRGASYGDMQDPSPLAGANVQYAGTGYDSGPVSAGPIDSPQVSVKASGDRGASYGERMDPSPLAYEAPNDTMSNDGTMMMQDDAMASDGDTVMVGGAPMYSDRNVVQNASQANNLTTLVAAVQAAELVETLEGPGPFTIFAPVNSAFDALPAGTVDTLLQPQNKGDLQNVLTYHVVPGTYDTDAILAQKGGNLSTSFTTVQGGSLTINPAGDDIYVIDSKGNAGRVIQSNVYQSNGVVHVIDTVMLP